MAKHRDDIVAINGAIVWNIMNIQRISRNALARLLNKDPSEIRMWLSGERKPTVDNAKALAKALNCTVRQLTGDEPYTAQGGGGPYAADAASGDNSVAQRHKYLVDAEALTEFMARLSWTPEQLAAKADVSIGVVNRALSGVEIERDFVTLLARALGVHFVQLTGKAPTVEVAGDHPIPAGYKRIVLSIDVPREVAIELIKHNFVGKLLADIEADDLLRDKHKVVDVIIRSIEIILEVSDDDADRLIEAFREGQLAHLDVTSVKVIPRRRWPWLSLGEILGLSGILCCPLSLIASVRPGACTIGLILSGLGLFFAYRRKTGWIVPALAALLNASILAFALYLAISRPHEVGGDTRREGAVQTAETPRTDPGGTKNTTEKSGDTPKAATEKEPQKPDKPIPTDEEIKKAKEKVKEAELKYDGADVVIADAVIASLVKWGDVSRLTAKDFKTQAKLLLPAATGLGVEVNCGTKTNYMGDHGGYSIFACPGASQGVALGERKHRLVVFVPFGEEGFGNPSITEWERDGKDYRYRVPTAGYLLVKLP